MVLVDYSSSDDSATDQTPIEVSPKDLKRKRGDDASDLPPLPTKFHDLYASTTRVSTRDDPSLHGGRKRATPHVEGNWPTHVYVEWYPKPAEYDSLTQLIATFQGIKTSEGSGKLHSFLTSDLGAPLPLHISLSRPIGVRTEQKVGFIASLQRSIAVCGIRPFDISPSGLDWVSNLEKTRWFLVLRLQRPDGDGLSKVLDVCNEVVEEYGQPPLYTHSSIFEEPSAKKTKEKTKGETVDKVLSNSFHISIAWMLDAPDAEAIKQARTVSGDTIFYKVKRICFTVEDIKSKVGNVITAIRLPLKVTESTNLFGV